MYVPMILMNLVNALMWVTYGIAGKPDPMIWGPNLAGALLAVAQVPPIYPYLGPYLSLSRWGPNLAGALLAVAQVA